MLPKGWGWEENDRAVWQQQDSPEEDPVVPAEIGVWELLLRQRTQVLGVSTFQISKSRGKDDPSD